MGTQKAAVSSDQNYVQRRMSMLAKSITLREQRTIKKKIEDER